MEYNFSQTLQGVSGLMFSGSVILFLFRVIFAELYRLRRDHYTLRGAHDTIHNKAEKEKATPDKANNGHPCSNRKGGLDE